MTKEKDKRKNEKVRTPRAASKYMCAEAQWTRCHRRMISDALTARGWDVRHITSVTRTEPHKLPEFAKVSRGRVSYPATGAGKLRSDDPRKGVESS